MKIQSSNTRQIYLFTPDGRKKEERYICPECSNGRRKQSEKVMAWDVQNNRGYCHHCNTSFFEYKPYEAKQYVVPEWKNKTELTDKAVRWFEGRGISQATLNEMRIYSDVEFMPQINKDVDCICFPYFREDKLVNIKYRGPQKTFKMVKGAELVLWNFDCLSDFDVIYITEGEIDALTYIENKKINVVSVPNGASKNLEYLDECFDLFRDMTSVYIAVDNDTKGIELRDELIRRIGAEKCLIADFKDCKDANEYYLKYGGIGFKAIEYREPQIRGIVDIDKLYNDISIYFSEGIQKGLEIGYNEIDQYITWIPGMLAICTGWPSSGKSEVIDYIVMKLNLEHGWKTAFFTPENYPLKFHYAKLFEKVIGKKFQNKYASEVEFDMAFEYIRENFFYILDEEDLSLEKILVSAKFLVRQRGIKCLVIDPYNKIDHKIDSKLSETQYISWFLDQLKTFAKLNDVLVILVAHPTKMQAGQIPTLYSISGSAHFYNKCDYGFTVHRMTDDNNIMQNEIQIHWQKIKFKHLGKQGISELKYNYNNGRFELLNSTVDTWDSSNWLIKDKTEVYANIDATEDVPF